MENIGWSAGDKISFKSRAYLFLLLTSLVVLSAWSGNLMASERGELPFFVDTASFQALDDSGKSYVEIYIMLSSKSLEFQEEEEEYWARLGIEASIADDTGGQRWSRRWRKEIVVSSAENLERGSSILDIAGLIVEPDFYDLRVDLKDELSGDTGFVAGELYVPNFPLDTLSMSQLELAVEITASEQEGDFVKNGLRVLPNPTRAYGPKVPILYFYAEIYDLLVGAGLDSTYTIRQEILNTSNELVKEYEPRTKRKPGRTCVEVGGINVLGLEPENYIYRLTVCDNASGAEVYSQRWFRVTPPEGDLGPPPSVSVPLTPQEAEHYENVIKYIASTNELKTYRSLSLEGRARFLENFWLQRDPDPSTPQNEFKQEHLRRWNYVNQQFSHFQPGDGWKSDRGRVYIVYGPPDDIERHPSDISTVAWERWDYYSLEGGAHFVFADLSGFDHFVLLHSNARNELHDWGWQEKLYRTH